MMMVWRAVLVASLFLFAAGAQASDAAYMAELIARAKEKNLAARIEWHNLLHYKPNLLTSGVHSLADEAGFFNSPQGKTDPAAELDATLTAFFVVSEETDSHQPSPCRFIARYHWLKQELNFEPGRIPSPPCRRFYTWRELLNPHELTLVFASAYLNNPASMYGHTLLRIDAKDQDERTRLLAYAVNYAANTNETSGLVFAVKGLFGGYPGQFSIAPYYLKVREYSDMENRDLWEYRLNFSAEEVDRLLMHIWELGPTYFEYYFFDENCSYHLLSAFEVARPSLSLTDRFRWWAIPSDTVGAVAQQPGLVREAVYRPSAATILRERVRNLSPDERDLARSVATRALSMDSIKTEVLAPERQAAVLETAYDYAAYRLRKDKLNSGVTEAFLRELLLVRSALPSTPAPSIPIPSTRPEQGHGTARMDIGYGQIEDRRFASLRLRPTYHDVLDSENGYTRGAQIEFFALNVRRYDDDETRLEEFRPLDILSISPRDDFLKSWSWKISVGAVRRPVAGAGEPLVGRLEFGAGLTWEPRAGARSSLTAMLEARADVESSLDHGYSFDLGPSLRWLVDLTPSWRADVRSGYVRSALGHDASDARHSIAQHWDIDRDRAVRLEMARTRAAGSVRDSAQLSWLLYF